MELLNQYWPQIQSVINNLPPLTLNTVILIIISTLFISIYNYLKIPSDEIPSTFNWIEPIESK